MNRTRRFRSANHCNAYTLSFSQQLH